jgi:hypothetical protein
MIEGITPAQVLFQLIVVTVGVYIATIAQQKAETRDRRDAAADLVVAIDAELAEDERSLDELVVAQQNMRELMLLVAKDARDEAPDTAISRITKQRLLVNRTFFPRKAAYATLLSGGQLQYIKNRQLRLDLAKVYEQDYARVAWNSEISDQIYQGIFRAAFLEYWDYAEDRPFAGNAHSAGKLSNAAYRVREYSVGYEQLLVAQRTGIQALRVKTKDYVVRQRK